MEQLPYYTLVPGEVVAHATQIPWHNTVKCRMLKLDLYDKNNLQIYSK